MNEILEAANSGNLRLAYRLGFRLLDELMLQAKWNEVEQILKKAIETNSDLAVGLMRFCSDGASYISRWQLFLAMLIDRLEQEGENKDEILRGLI